jgi:hypothetical protein
MRLPARVHESEPWRIAAIASDFRLEDVWTLPAHGSAEDFGALLEVMASLDPTAGGSRAARLLFALRRRLGRLFRWDDIDENPAMPGGGPPTLRMRLPADLRDTATNDPRSLHGFRPLYRTDVESAAELSNRTVHAVLHLAWVEQEAGSYRGHMAVYVKPLTRFGALYMRLIAPFRRRVVYPALLRQIEWAWSARLPRHR